MLTKFLDPFGVEVHELSLVNAKQAADTLRPILEHSGFAVLRNQQIDDAQFVAFLEALGPMVFTDGEKPVENAPMLNVVSNVGRKTPPRSVFHTDTSYVPQPPSFTALRPVTLPELGGATLVSDQCAVYESLSSEEVEALQHARVKHRVTGIDGRDDFIWHPLLRRQPGTDRVSVFLSTPERCVEMEGAGTGAPDLETLYQRSTDAEFVYAHRWQPGDILIWDNRTTMHRADHSGVVGDRVMHRGMVAGEAPVPAFP